MEIRDAVTVAKSLLETCYEGKTKDGKNNPVYCIGGVETTSKYYNYKEALETLIDLASHNIEEPKKKYDMSGKEHTCGLNFYCHGCYSLGYGQAIMDNQNHIDECPTCRGSGTYEITGGGGIEEPECSICNGTGKVVKKPFPKDLVREKLENLRTANNINPICVKADVDTVLAEIKKLMEGRYP